MRIHLLDATWELFRAHFGRPPHAGADGMAVGGVLGVVESIVSLLRAEDGVTHLGCATDHEIRSWRNDRWPGYKTEAGMDPQILAQIPLLADALTALGLVVWPMVENEADDALATAAARWADAPGVEQVVILSPDKDLAQCVREDGRVVLYDRRKQRFSDAADVRARFGVPPASIPDWLALVGDSADGYPGVPGWGAVSAAAVLARYPHLEEIPTDARRWDLSVRGAERLAAAFREHRDDAFLFRELATLRTDAPIPQTDPAELRWRGADPVAFPALVARLRAPRLLERVALRTAG